MRFDEGKPCPGLLHLAPGPEDFLVARLVLEQVEGSFRHLIGGIRLCQLGLAEEQVVLGNRTLFEKLAAPFVDLLGLVQRCFRADKLSACPLDIRRQRAGRDQLQVGLGIGDGRKRLVLLGKQVLIFELREHLASRDVVAFPDEQLPDGRRHAAAYVRLLTGKHTGGSPHDYFDVGSFGPGDLHLHDGFQRCFLGGGASRKH